MSSQDSRAPFRMQRFVECVNVGQTALSAYAVAEVTGATQPESGETTSVAMARTVLQVQQPSADGIDNVVIIGPKEIPVDGHGICTNDYPTYALIDTGQGFAAGDVGGVAEDSQSIGEGGDFIILGDIGTGTSAKARVMLARNKWYIGKVTGYIISAGGTGTVEQHKQTWEGTGITFAVLNPHDVDLQVGLKVRWTHYPGWTDWIVEPWHFTEC